MDRNIYFPTAAKSHTLFVPSPPPRAVSQPVSGFPRHRFGGGVFGGYGSGRGEQAVALGGGEHAVGAPQAHDALHLREVGGGRE